VHGPSLVRGIRANWNQAFGTCLKVPEGFVPGRASVNVQLPHEPVPHGPQKGHTHFRAWPFVALADDDAETQFTESKVLLKGC